MSGIAPVRFPAELHQARSDVLEEYVQNRIAQLVSVFTRRLQSHAPALPNEVISKSLAEAYQAVPPPEYSVIPLEDRDLQLVFRHDCMALGCLDPQCALCQHNPCRRCVVNFDRKYLVSDLLKARCGASIRIELVDRNTGMPIEEDIPDLRLETYILDGNLYDNKFLEGGRIIEGGTEPEEELEACALMLNKKKNTPLLVCGTGGVNDPQAKVILPMPRGNKVNLPELHVSDSSEAILSGRKPPFRLLVRALLPQGRKLRIRHAISEGFVVATRRTRTAGKVEIPSLEDHVSKLEHMGKETVRKLQDIAIAGMQVGIELDVGELNCIQKVGDFKALSLRAEEDGHLRQRLQHVLKLSREKWEEARDHAMRAVKGDSLMRVWYADRRATEMGLLFACRLGSVELERPVALIQTRTENGEPQMEATMIPDLVPVQRELVHRMQPQAAHSWWLGGHPGWAIFPVDSEQFMMSGSLVAIPLLDPSHQYNGLGAFGGMGMLPMPMPGMGQLGGLPRPPPSAQSRGGAGGGGGGGMLALPALPQQQWMAPGGGAPPGMMGMGGGGARAPGGGGGRGGAARGMNPFGDVALGGGGGGAGGGGTGTSSGSQGQGQGRSTPSAGGGPLAKRAHEPMLHPSASGSHEQRGQGHREFLMPGGGQLALQGQGPFAGQGHPGQPSNLGGGGQQQRRVSAASLAAVVAAAAAAAEEAGGSGGGSDPCNPNPFVSIQHHPSPGLAPVMAQHLGDGGQPSLDLSALASVPMDPSMFHSGGGVGPTGHHHGGHGGQDHSGQQQGQQHAGGQRGQQHQAGGSGGGAAQAAARAYVQLHGGSGGGARGGHLGGPVPSLGLGNMNSVELDKMLNEGMETSLGLGGGSLQLPHNFLQGVMSSVLLPGGHGGGAGGAATGAHALGDGGSSGGHGGGGGGAKGHLRLPTIVVTANGSGSSPGGGGSPLHSKDSALDTMQSIEQALPDVAQQVHGL